MEPLIWTVLNISDIKPKLVRPFTSDNADTLAFIICVPSVVLPSACCPRNIILPHACFFLILSKQCLGAERNVPLLYSSSHSTFPLFPATNVPHTQTPPAQSNICLSVIGRRLCFTEWGCSRFRSTKRPHSAGAMQLYCTVRQLCQFLQRPDGS